MDEVELRVVLEEGVEAPSYATLGSAGMDLRCNEEIDLGPGERALVGTGLRVAIPRGFEGQVRPRSGLAVKYGISMVNTPGTIDSDYRGEVRIALINLGADVVRLAKGERIAQLVICPVARAKVVSVNRLEDTERGEGGFGSTGTK